ncbi:FAD-dependent monooxygenase [Nocardia pseudovaccinii]|uniref:FAD-dependent monooxygenase n=1 Tax=Nocardia pseudovaccinii TaxID=189540 RepID=UPI0007A3ACA6|nr:FAD-dependent monooxygenase [Nocardia pseudovaccinii]
MLYDVIIAGAGPVGLLLACELRLADCSVLVLERAEDPYSPLKELPFGMRGITVPTAETFYRRGLLDDIAGGTTHLAVGEDGAPRRRAGHFAGIEFEDSNIETARWQYRLPSPADTNMAAEMKQIEAVLADRARSLGAEIRRGHGVDDFSRTENGVTVRIGAESVRGRWLVGCDGGRSTVRKLGGFDFAGSEPLFTGYLAEVEIADPEAIRQERTITSTGFYLQPDPGMIAMLEFDGGAAHRTAPLTLEHIQEVLRRVSQTDVTLTALRLATTWTDRAQQATTYRDGRVLLAGDAAHIHSPLGAQGLNAGLGDAMNLGWKLAATIRGEAPEGLLDTYQDERHPVGAQVLEWSRAQTAIMLPTPQSLAMGSIISDLIGTPSGATYFAERMWNAALRYNLGGAHPLIGRSVPDFELLDGTRVAELLRDGQGLLLDFDSELAQARALWRDLKYVPGDVRERLGLAAVLVRPDGVVAWACDEHPDPAELNRAALRWFTSAARVPAI